MDKIVRIADLELRSSNEESRIVEGVACVFNQKTDLGWFTEEIDRHAFDDSDMTDVVLNLNHNNSLLLARTTNGSLKLHVDDYGLNQKAEIVETSTGKDVLTLVKEGLISKMSFAFTIADGGCEWISKDNEKEHRIIKKIDRLYDVSLVTFPAYEQTSVFARSDDKIAEQRKQELERIKTLNERMEKLTNGIFK